MNDAERLSIVKAIFDCDEADAATLLGSTRLVHSEAAATLALQGDPAENCQFVVNGAIRLIALGSDGQYTQIATVEPGEVFGAYPVHTTHAVEAVADEALETFVIATSQLRRLANDSSAIASGLASLFAAQLSAMLGRLAARVTLTAKGRVYRQLLDESDMNGRIEPVPIVSSLAVKAQTARETASRAISDLERRGILRREASGWTIVSRRMLEELAY